MNLRSANGSTQFSKCRAQITPRGRRGDEGGAAQPEAKAAEAAPRESPPTQAEPAAREVGQPGEKNAKQSKATSGETQRQGSVQPGANSRWYHGLGEKMATFWRVGRHWLEVLRLNLARPWIPAVFQILPGSS